jgi:hypothetical protein
MIDFSEAAGFATRLFCDALPWYLLLAFAHASTCERAIFSPK